MSQINCSETYFTLYPIQSFRSMIAGVVAQARNYFVVEARAELFSLVEPHLNAQVWLWCGRHTQIRNQVAWIHMYGLVW